MVFSYEDEPHPWEEIDFHGKPLRRYNPDCDEKKIIRFPLYLYVGEKALRSILSTGKIKLSRPQRTNDFMEGVTPDEETRNNINQFGYICLSSTCHSPAMWGYYADRGRGACLMFNFEVFDMGEQTYEILESGLFPVFRRKFIRKVEYIERNSKTEKPTAKNPLKILYQKDKTWESEQEYRILRHLHSLHPDDIEYSTDDSNLVEYYDTDIMENLETVILGPKCKYECIEVESMLRKLLKKETYQISEKWFGYSLSSEVPPILCAKALRADDILHSKYVEHNENLIPTHDIFMRLPLGYRILTGSDSSREWRLLRTILRTISSKCGYELYHHEGKFSLCFTFKTVHEFELFFIPVRRGRKIDFLLFRRNPKTYQQDGDLRDWLWVHDVASDALDVLKKKFEEKLIEKAEEELKKPEGQPDFPYRSIFKELFSKEMPISSEETISWEVSSSPQLSQDAPLSYRLFGDPNSMVGNEDNQGN